MFLKKRIAMQVSGLSSEGMAALVTEMGTREESRPGAGRSLRVLLHPCCARFPSESEGGGLRFGGKALPPS